MRYVFELTKIIVVEIEAADFLAAQGLANMADAEYDGAWARATPNTELLSEEEDT